MKKIICCLLVAVMLSACGGETKKSEAKQEPNPNTELETRQEFIPNAESETNQESVPRKEGEKRVGDIIMVNGAMGIVYAVTSDGQHGKVVSVTRGECSWEAAKQWCAQYGRGWRMPSKDELLVIYRKKGVLDPILKANGYTTLSDWCWSSTEYDSDRAWFASMDDGCTYDLSKGLNHYVRAVSAF